VSVTTPILAVLVGPAHHSGHCVSVKADLGQNFRRVFAELGGPAHIRSRVAFELQRHAGCGVATEVGMFDLDDKVVGPVLLVVKGFIRQVVRAAWNLAWSPGLSPATEIKPSAVM
jgi:hypothetical protein